VCLTLLRPHRAEGDIASFNYLAGDRDNSTVRSDRYSGRNVRLTKSRSVVIAKKRARMAVANMVRASVSQLDYAFAIPGYVLPFDGLLLFVSPARRGQVP
jgi:hypothetical protein